MLSHLEEIWASNLDFLNEENIDLSTLHDLCLKNECNFKNQEVFSLFLAKLLKQGQYLTRLHFNRFGI